MKKGIYKLVLVIVLLVLAVGSCRKAGSWLVKSDDIQQADAMIMLMGGISDRVLQIADLYQQNVAGEVWIVEEGSGAKSNGYSVMRIADDGTIQLAGFRKQNDYKWQA